MPLESCLQSQSSLLNKPCTTLFLGILPRLLVLKMELLNLKLLLGKIVFCNKSACFGAPFLVWHPTKYATMLAEKMKKHNSHAWLINTGWNGGAYGVGKRISLKYSRAIIDAIHNGELQKAEYETYPVFGLSIPKKVTGVPSEILHPSKTWLGTQESYSVTVKKLGRLFNENFKTYQDLAADEVLKAGPVL